MTESNLEALLNARGNPVTMLRNSPTDAFVYPVVATEFSNWRDEQYAWRHNVVLFDQSHHMCDLMVEGPDAAQLLCGLAVNSFAGFRPGKAKQFVACSPSGHVIGDNIMFYLAENQILLVGRAPSINWVEYRAQISGLNVTTRKDMSSPNRPNGHPVLRERYRYQIQGPFAPLLLEKLNGGPIQEIKFFNLGHFRIGGQEVHALRHGMGGVPGLEFWGPYEDRDRIKAIIMEAGAEFGIRAVGSRAYSTSAVESGWIPSPLPAIYTDPELQGYREWLPATGYEATAPIGGSFVSDNIEDYYVTPYQIGYGPFVKFDHDFVGRKALEAIAEAPQRRKVSLVWNAEDVGRVQNSLLRPTGPNYKYIEMPLANYAASNYDRVERNGRLVGFSMFSGYLFNERSFVSLATVDGDLEEGDEVVITWGEENGGTAKSTVEMHTQTTIRATVGPVPISKLAREDYASGWRNRAAG